MVDWGDIAQAAIQAYGAYNQSRPGRFQQAPESPELTAMRQKMIGYINNSPTRNMLGDMLQPMLQRSATDNFQLPQGANGYNPNGNTGAPKYDLSKIFSNMASSSNPRPGVPAGQLDPSLAPPPPPDHAKTGAATKSSEYKAIGAGLLGGGIVGGITGGISGILKHRHALHDYNNAQNAYADWVKQYGSQFGANVPQTMDDYQKWYQATYGVPYQAPVTHG